MLNAKAVKRISQLAKISPAKLRREFKKSPGEFAALMKKSDAAIKRTWRRVFDKVVKRNIYENDGKPIPKELAKRIFEETRKFNTSRISSPIVFDNDKRLPPYVTRAQVKQHGYVIKRGKYKGAKRVYIDMYYGKVLTPKVGIKLRRDIREVQFTRNVLDLTIGQLGKLRAFIPKDIKKKVAKRKKKTFTPSEAKRIAKVINKKAYTQKVYEAVREVFGGS